MDSNADNNVFRFTVLRSARGERPQRLGRSAIERRTGERAPTAAQQSGTHERPGLESLRSALRELDALDYRSLATLNDDGVPVLQPLALGRLSQPTRELTAFLGMSLNATPIESVRNVLLTRIREFGRRGDAMLPAAQAEPEPSHLRAVGVSELLVVKQQIKRYEPGEVAYIENVFGGESKTRTTRTLDRIEEQLILVEEKERERETENQATERFELNRETSRTQESDRKTGFGLSLSGKYGPSVEFKSNLETSSSNSESMTQSLAIEYAKEVVERSKERIIERVRRERRITVVREVEETTQRQVVNALPEHRSGSYQFVDKIYESQIFNYGLRQIFDFMVPEPASFLWHLEEQPNPDIEIPAPPTALAIEAATALDINEGNYARLAARYEAQGVKPPPPLFTRRITHLKFGTGGAGAEAGKPMGRVDADVDVPDGYDPWLAFWSAMGTTDDVATIAVSLGNVNDLWSPSGQDLTGLGEGSYRLFRTADPRPLFGSIAMGSLDTAQKLKCEAIGFETANYSIDVTVHFVRSNDGYLRWQHETYAAIADAYANAMLRYEQALQVYRQHQAGEAARAINFGENPSINQQIIRRELKKHCLAFMRNEHLGDPATDHPIDNPPRFDIADALVDGKTVRFLELSFEWEQMQYVFYPYYWARQDSWAKRFGVRNVDPELQEFLSAGYARAVVPVRPGFEAAVAHFMETRQVYEGNGDPEIDDPLYESIVTEIRERAAAGTGEVPVGEPWETRMPTSLLYVRSSDELPRWKREEPDAWKWVPEN